LMIMSCGRYKTIDFTAKYEEENPRAENHRIKFEVGNVNSQMLCGSVVSSGVGCQASCGESERINGARCTYHTPYIIRLCI
jgi:hypothetical protein